MTPWDSGEALGLGLRLAGVTPCDLGEALVLVVAPWGAGAGALDAGVTPWDSGEALGLGRLGEGGTPWDSVEALGLGLGRRCDALGLGGAAGAEASARKCGSLGALGLGLWTQV